MNETKAALVALMKHRGDIALATAESGLLESFVRDIARKFRDYLSGHYQRLWQSEEASRNNGPVQS